MWPRIHVAEVSVLAGEYLGERDGVEQVSADELAERLARGQVVVLDVRPRAEYAAGHIAGAVSAPLEALAARLPKLPRRRRGGRLLPRPLLRVRRRRRAAAAGARAL